MNEKQWLWPKEFKPESLTKKNSKQFLDWYLSQSLIRIEELEKNIKLAHAQWQANLKSESLLLLGEWFSQNLTTEKRSDEEMKAIYASFPQWAQSIKVSSHKLTQESYSLINDVAYYFAQTIKNKLPSLEWKVDLDNKKNINYGQPLLFNPKNPKKVPLNPFHIILTLAQGIVSGRKTGKRLAELYEVWMGMLS